MLQSIIHPQKNKRVRRLKLNALIEEQDIFELIEPETSLEDVILNEKTQETLQNLMRQVDKEVITRLIKWGVKDKKSGISSNDLFIRVNLSKTSVYQGEHIIASIKVYTRVGLRSLDDVKFPSYTGFLSPDIDIPTRISLQRENVGGKVFEVGLLKQNILFPQKTGQLTIEPASVEVYVREKVGKGRDFFGRIVDRYENVKKEGLIKTIANNIPIILKRFIIPNF